MLVEAPTYDRPLKILARLGAEIVAVPMDDEGLIPDELPDGEFAFLYTIPTFQNPSGRTMSEARRRRLAELAAERGLLVLEDDPYGLVRYEGDALPSLFELSGGATAYCSSFSKTVAPGLRVGWFVLPAELAAQLEALATSTYISPPYLSQATVLEFMTRGELRTEPRARERPPARAARRDARALEREMPADATWTRPDGGYFVWLELPSAPPATELLTRAEEAGVTFVQGSDFYAGGHGGAAVAAARLQLRLARTRSQTASPAWRRSRRLRRLRRSSAASSIPPTSPTARARRISQIRETCAVTKTKCSETDFLFSRTNATA